MTRGTLFSGVKAKKRPKFMQATKPVSNPIPWHRRHPKKSNEGYQTRLSHMIHGFQTLNRLKDLIRTQRTKQRVIIANMSYS
jgi:hypothetical protein